MNSESHDSTSRSRTYQQVDTALFLFMLLVFSLPIFDVFLSTYDLVKYGFTFLFSLGLSWWATPLARNTALRYNIVDKPDGRLKDHERPTPYLGGIVVYISFLFPPFIFIL